MATIGNTTTPASGYYFDDNANHQFGATWGAFPSPGGTITDIYGYVGGHNTVTSVRLCVWADGALLYASSPISAPSSGNVIGGQSWLHASGVNLYVPAGTQNIGIGFWAAGAVIWTYESGGAVVGQSGVSSPTTFSGTVVAGSNALGGYVVYTPLAAPTVTSATPTAAGFGQTVIITGTNFAHISSVTIGGASATYTVDSTTQITATVPSGATPGVTTIVVTNPAGSDSIAFTVGGIARINTGTPASPVWTTGVIYVNTSTPASPNWTTGPVYVWNGSAWVSVT